MNEGKEGMTNGLPCNAKLKQTMMLKRTKEKMKKIILLALIAFMMAGCTYTKKETVKNLSVDGYILKEIDSCEYFMVHVSSYMDGGCYLPIHKSNCRFCAERRQKELKELVEQLKR